jgi:hypothetical protein
MSNLDHLREEFDWLYLGQQVIQSAYEDDEEWDDEDEYLDLDEDDDEEWDDDEIDEDEDEDEDVFYTIRTFYSENLDQFE